MLRRIVVPLDGSALAESALPTAFALARAAGAALKVVTVTAPRRTEIVTAPSRAVTDFISTSGRHATPYLEHLAERFWRATHEQLVTTVVHGNVVEELVEYTSAEGGDLIVMTGHGRGGIKRAVFGSTAAALIPRVRAPLLLMPALQPARLSWEVPLFRQVLITLDESDYSEEVLPFAIAIGQLAEADYTLLEVVVNTHASDAGVRLNFETDLHLSRARAAAEAHLARIGARLERRGLEVTTAVIDHPAAARAILDYATSTQADLIAMSTHGRTGIRRVVLGSVAEDVGRSSDVPVLLYRPGSGI